MRHQEWWELAFESKRLSNQGVNSDWNLRRYATISWSSLLCSKAKPAEKHKLTNKQLPSWGTSNLSSPRLAKRCSKRARLSEKYCCCSTLSCRSGANDLPWFASRPFQPLRSHNLIRHLRIAFEYKLLSSRIMHKCLLFESMLERNGPTSPPRNRLKNLYQHGDHKVNFALLGYGVWTQGQHSSLDPKGIPQYHNQI